MESPHRSVFFCVVLVGICGIALGAESQTALPVSTLVVQTFDQSLGCSPCLVDVHLTTGKTSLVHVDVPHEPSPGWIDVNNGYKMAVTEQFVYSVSQWQKGNTTSKPTLLEMPRGGGAARVVAELPMFNYLHISEIQLHVTFNAQDGTVLVTGLNYDDPTAPTGPSRYIAVSVTPKSGTVDVLARMPDSEGMVAEEGTYITSRGWFCDNVFIPESPSPFQQLQCFDLRSGASTAPIKANVSDNTQLADFQWDSVTDRLVGIGLCCDPQNRKGCPAECLGKSFNRTWSAWDTKTSKVDILSFLEKGPTWLTLGSALNAPARVFTYCAADDIRGNPPAPHSCKFVHLNATNGKALGATSFDANTLGQPFAFGYA